MVAVAQKDPKTHKEYKVCGNSVRGEGYYSIRLIKQLLSGDTTYYRLYFREELGGFAKDFYLIKLHNSKYQIASDLDGGQELSFYELFDLEANIGNVTRIPGLFFYDEAAVTLRSKRFSAALGDTLYYFDIHGSCASHTVCMSEFVFTRNLGIVRVKYEPVGSCKYYIFQCDLLRKRESDDDGLTELFAPISKHH